MAVLIWFRRDLRVHDHSALYYARKTGEAILPVFIVEDTERESGGQSGRQAQAIRSALHALQGNLARLGASLLIKRGEPAAILAELARQYQADKLFFNRDYTPGALARDERVAQELQHIGVFTQTFKDLVMHEQSELLNKQGKPYVVFTPYKRTWLTLPKDKPLPAPQQLNMVAGIEHASSEAIPEWNEWEVARYGEAAARERLQSFVAEYAHVDWDENEELFRKWRMGETGYPIVDAGMRQLNQTGWMHNRVRMIAASFLVKDLLIDWRKGMRYFAERLIDHDEAANCGGWQWCASTGIDAQPYFRIFNPVSQGEKFDAEGAYVKRYIPELLHVPPKYIHKPWQMPEHVQQESGCIIGLDYPPPCVDHATSRFMAIERFSRAKRLAK